MAMGIDSELLGSSISWNQFSVLRTGQLVQLNSFISFFGV